jgi:hypothetical protein
MVTTDHVIDRQHRQHRDVGEYKPFKEIMSRLTMVGQSSNYRYGKMVNCGQMENVASEMER